jgi:hypothetical protein
MVKEGLLAPEFLGIKAFPTGTPTFQHWWEWTLIAIIVVSAVIGIFAGVWYSFRSIRGLLKVR